MAVGQSAKPGAQVPGDRPGAARPNGPRIEFGHTDHFGGGTGEKHLVGGIKVVAVQGQLLHLSAGRAVRQQHSHGEGEHHKTRYQLAKV